MRHSYLEKKHNTAQTFRTINTGTHLFREKTYGTSYLEQKILRHNYLEKENIRTYIIRAKIYRGTAI